MADMDPAIRDLVGEIDYDPNELRRRYAYERDVRLRPDKNQQYVETTAQFSHYVDDPYVEPIDREPLHDHVEVAIIGGGIGGLLVGARLREQGFEDRSEEHTSELQSLMRISYDGLCLNKKKDNPG